MDSQLLLPSKSFFLFSSMIIFSRATMSSLEIQNGHQSTQLLLKMWTLRITWVECQRFRGLCQRSHLHLQPPASTGRRTSNATFRLTVRHLFQTSVASKMEVGISCIQRTPNAKGSFDVLGHRQRRSLWIMEILFTMQACYLKSCTDLCIFLFCHCV